MLIASKELVLGTEVSGLHVISLAARFSVATRSRTLADGLAKILAARGSMLVTLHALSSRMGPRSVSVLHGACNEVRTMILSLSWTVPTSCYAAPIAECKPRQPRCFAINVQPRDVAQAIVARAADIFRPIGRHHITHVFAGRPQKLPAPVQVWSSRPSAFVTALVLRNVTQKLTAIRVDWDVLNNLACGTATAPGDSRFQLLEACRRHCA